MDIKAFLDQKVALYNRPEFIENDPIQIPHEFKQAEDREISGFLAACIAWGQRKTIIKNARKLMAWMDDSPHDFLLNSSLDERKVFESFVHRTFNGTDCRYFIDRLSLMYIEEGGLRQCMGKAVLQNGVAQGLHDFKQRFFQISHPHRTQKHLSDPLKGSSAKRLNMFLRWMVRKDNAGVDFGIWSEIPMAQLSIPLDVHSGRIARELGLLSRKQNDQKAVSELDVQLRIFDPYDPVKYDFALFGLGVNEDF